MCLKIQLCKCFAPAVKITMLFQKYLDGLWIHDIDTLRWFYLFKILKIILMQNCLWLWIGFFWLFRRRNTSEKLEAGSVFQHFLIKDPSVAFFDQIFHGRIVSVLSRSLLLFHLQKMYLRWGTDWKLGFSSNLSTSCKIVLTPFLMQCIPDFSTKCVGALREEGRKGWGKKDWEKITEKYTETCW